ncbi:MAG TPA: carbon-nitrogen hydrolase family protein [Nitrospiria bacterium]|nr:carbon-nitrogen hydrolase family protein [Nitrospiria bacterium]
MELTLAAVQMESVPYEVDENLLKAEKSIQKAAEQGARVAVLPELFNTGYCYDVRNFRVGESLWERTGRWFREMGKRFGLYVAGTMIEKDRGRFYDTMVLATPEGRLARYRKLNLYLLEKCYFSRGDHPLILDTPIGRIGTGICVDLLFRKIWDRYRNRVDLLLVSSAWPDLTRGGGIGKGNRINRRLSMLPRELPGRLAEALGVPVVYANLCGRLVSPLPFLPPFRMESRFVGASAIYAGGGERIGDAGVEEGIVVRTVRLGEGGEGTGRYRVEPLARAMTRLDRMVMTVPCSFYRLRHRPR